MRSGSPSACLLATSHFLSYHRAGSRERIALSRPAGNVSFPVLPQSGQQRADRPQQACWQRLISCPTTERAAESGSPSAGLLATSHFLSYHRAGSRADRPQQACWQRLISCPTTERAAESGSPSAGLLATSHFLSYHRAGSSPVFSPSLLDPGPWSDVPVWKSEYHKHPNHYLPSLHTAPRRPQTGHSTDCVPCRPHITVQVDWA